MTESRNLATSPILLVPGSLKYSPKTSGTWLARCCWLFGHNGRGGRGRLFEGGASGRPGDGRMQCCQAPVPVRTPVRLPPLQASTRRVWLTLLLFASRLLPPTWAIETLYSIASLSPLCPKMTHCMSRFGRKRLTWEKYYFCIPITTYT